MAQAILAFKNPTEADGDLQRVVAMARKADWEADGWTKEALESRVAFFETQDVFFSSPLDLDMLMLEAFPEEYTILKSGALGPQKPDDPDRQLEAARAVLKVRGYGVDAYAEYTMLPLFPWYSYLFLGNRGKPAIHLSALSQLDDAALTHRTPAVLKRLLERVQTQLETSGT